MSRPVPLEALGECDPASEANFPGVLEWARAAYGLEKPPPLEPPVSEYPLEVIDVEEDEYEARVAELLDEVRLAEQLAAVRVIRCITLRKLRMFTPTRRCA